MVLGDGGVLERVYESWGVLERVHELCGVLERVHELCGVLERVHEKDVPKGQWLLVAKQGGACPRNGAA